MTAESRPNQDGLIVAYSTLSYEKRELFRCIFGVKEGTTIT
jgi:hypothetical protein